MRIRLLLTAAALLVSSLAAAPAIAEDIHPAIGRYRFNPLGHAMQLNAHGRVAARHATLVPWHYHYRHTEWGQPLALVVPPTADSQMSYGWGVGNTRCQPIFHQFTRPYPGDAYGQGGYGQFHPTPHWPSDTMQSGVYYIRGPW